MSVNESTAKGSEKKANVQLDSALKELLRVKDEVTSKLLQETKKSSDLAQLQSSVEEQLREGVERSLQNIRTEFVKRRKKLVPTVKQLETASASLCKAERALQQYNRNSNSNIRKCKQRIKAAKQVLMECTPKTDLFSNIQRYINDEIAFLREKLLSIPNSLNIDISELLQARPDRDTPLDSDSDLSVDVEVNKHQPECTTAKEIRHSKPTTNKTECKHTMTTNMQTQSDTNSIKAKTYQLNGVDLFTSDSDSLDEYFDTGSYRPIGPFSVTKTDDIERSRQTQGDDTSARSSFTEESYSDVKVAYENTLEFLEWQRTMNSDNQNRTTAASNKSKFLLEKPAVQLNTSTQKRASRRDEVYMTSSQRANQKRFLPIVPTQTNSDETPRSSKRYANPCKSNDPFQTNSHISSTQDGDKVLKNEMFDESLDVEEMQFKETVKTTSQQIIDTIKSKCAAAAIPKYDSLTSTMNFDDTATLLAPCSSIFSESLDSTLTSVKDSGVDMKDLTFKRVVHPCKTNMHTQENGPAMDNICKNTPGSCSLSGKSSSKNIYSNNKNKATTEPIYNWKRVEVFKRCENALRTEDMSRTMSLNDTNESKVSLAIKKYEMANNKSVADTPRYNRSRSATGPRIKYDNSFISNRALRPRADATDHSFCGNTMTDNERFNNDRTVDDITCSIDTSLPINSKPTTGADLQQICARESRKAIRETWRYRRSHSMTPSVPRSNLKESRTSEIVGSFMLPNHGSKCNVSGLAVLSNEHVVALDEVHCYLVLFDSRHQFVSQYNIVDVPSGITKMVGTMFAISYPFRFKIGIFEAQNGVIAHARDIHVKCQNWLTDLCFVYDIFHVLCKGGHIHILNKSGDESKRLIVGVNGKLVINEMGKRIYVIGTEQITRFDSDGNEMSRRMDISAFHAILIDGNLHVGDRNKHRLVPLSESKRVSGFTIDDLKYPCAMALHQDLLFISSFDETLSVEDTRTVKVFRLRK